jgi:hypothetical protein
MKPFVIVPRMTAEKELKYYGHDKKDAILLCQGNTFMTSALFEWWATSVFFPAIEQRRRECDSHRQVILLMDGLGSHHSDKFLRDCTARDIKVIFLVSHTSDQVQPLDLLTFALMKQRFSASKFDWLANPQSNTVVRIFGAWFAANAHHHNVEAFMNPGLIPEESAGRFSLKVIPEQARRVRELSRSDTKATGVAFGSDGQRRFQQPDGQLSGSPTLPDLPTPGRHPSCSSRILWIPPVLPAYFPFSSHSFYSPGIPSILPTFFRFFQHSFYPRQILFILPAFFLSSSHSSCSSYIPSVPSVLPTSFGFFRLSLYSSDIRCILPTFFRFFQHFFSPPDILSLHPAFFLFFRRSLSPRILFILPTIVLSSWRSLSSSSIRSVLPTFFLFVSHLSDSDDISLFFQHSPCAIEILVVSSTLPLSLVDPYYVGTDHR